MTFRPGQSGNPSGRPKGSRNKLTLKVVDRLEALGCNPIEGMARIAMDEKAELSLRAQMYKELAAQTRDLHERLDGKCQIAPH
jgi:hypothetical protein